MSAYESPPLTSPPPSMACGNRTPPTINQQSLFKQNNLPSLKPKQNLQLDAEFSYQKHGIFLQATQLPICSYLYLSCQIQHCRPRNLKQPTNKLQLNNTLQERTVIQFIQKHILSRMHNLDREQLAPSFSSSSSLLSPNGVKGLFSRIMQQDFTKFYTSTIFLNFPLNSIIESERLHIFLFSCLF